MNHTDRVIKGAACFVPFILVNLFLGAIIHQDTLLSPQESVGIAFAIVMFFAVGSYLTGYIIFDLKDDIAKWRDNGGRK